MSYVIRRTFEQISERPMAFPNGPKSHASNGGPFRPGLNLSWPVPFPNMWRRGIKWGFAFAHRLCRSHAPQAFKSLRIGVLLAILRPPDRMAGVLNGGSAAWLSCLVKIQRFRVPWEWIMECLCGTNGPRPRDRNPSCQRRMMGSIISGCRARSIRLPAPQSGVHLCQR